MLEKKGTIIFESILERYIYLRNTQKQLKITNYVCNKNFLSQKGVLFYNFQLDLLEKVKQGEQ